MKTIATSLATMLIAANGNLAWAHGAAGDAAKDMPVEREQKPWGVAGQVKNVTRTIDVSMTDRMRFSPEKIDVRQGDTVKFVLRNGGKVLHEFVIGTRKDLDAHAALMVKFPNMEHDQPYMSHSAPGNTDRHHRLEVQQGRQVSLRLPDRRPLTGRHDWKNHGRRPMNRRPTPARSFHPPTLPSQINPQEKP